MNKSTEVDFGSSSSEDYNKLVFIRTLWENGDRSSATGFLVGRNDIMTAAHVV